MVVVEAWKCDGCGKLIEIKSEVYKLKLSSLPFRDMSDPECIEQVNEIELHFCRTCAKDLLNTLKRIVNMKND